MPCLLGKFHYLVFNRRTVSGACTLNDPGIDRRAIYILTDDIMSLLVSICEEAGDLFDLNVRRIRRIGERNDHLISLLDRHLGIVKRSSIHSGRRSGLESAKGNTDPIQGILEAGRSLHAAGAGLCDGFADKAAGIEICAGADDRSLTSVDSACVDPDSNDFMIFCEDLHDFRLPDRQIFLVFKHLSHGL